MLAINLLPIYRREARQRRVLRRWWLWTCAGYTTALFLIALVIISIIPTQIGVSEAELDRLTESVAHTQHTIADYNPKLDQARRTLRANLSVRSQPDWSLLLMLLSKVAGDEVVLRRCQLDPVEAVASAGEGAKPTAQKHQNPTSYTLRLSGLARTQAQTSQFLLRLEETGLFETVRLINTSGSRIDEVDVSAFELVCSLASQQEGKP